MRVPDDFKEQIAQYVKTRIAPMLDTGNSRIYCTCHIGGTQMDANGFFVTVRITVTEQLPVSRDPAVAVPYRTADVKVPMVKMGSSYERWWLEIDSASPADIQWAVEV